MLQRPYQSNSQTKLKEGDPKMKIVECLKKETGVRLSVPGKWLVWNGTIQAWIVYKKAPRRTMITCTTKDEEIAISALMMEEI